MAKPKPDMKPCPICSGRKVISFGTAEVKCARCGGKGVVKA